MLEKALKTFNEYMKNYDMSTMEISLKYNHSLAVMDLMGELAFRLGLDKEKIELAKLIGLLHDIGRFEQWKKFDSYSDIKTSFDHAEYGTDYLFKDNHIREYIDSDKYDNIIEKAIRNHNRYEIEKGLDEEELLFSKMIRDMDKTDIFKQTAIHYEKNFDVKEVNQEILEEFKEERIIDISKRKTKTDSTLSILAFIFDYNFNESFDILVESDNFDLFLSVVDVSEDSEKLWKKIKELCFDKINRGV